MIAARKHLGLLACLLGGLGIPASPLNAFDPPKDTAGPLTVHIEGPSDIDQVGTPIAYRVVVESTAGEPIRGAAKLSGIDGWRAQPSETVAFTVEAKGRQVLDFAVTADPRSYTALYPIHAHVNFSAGGPPLTAHAILVVSTRNPSPPQPVIPPIAWQPVRLRPDAELLLDRLQARRVVIAPFAGPAMAMPIGWWGAEPGSRAYFEFGTRVERGGEVRTALAIHPPYHGGRTGTAGVQYPVELPAGVPVRLRFANAIRDHNPASEPPSDGVTFRVRVLPFTEGIGFETGTLVYEKHTDSKTWSPADVDLSRFAGQAVIIQLESHPGPKKDTTCDHSYWAEPLLVTGQRTLAAATAGTVFPPVKDTPSRLLGTIEANGRSWQVKLWPGERGLLDAAVGIEGDRRLLFHGFRVRVNGADLEQPSSPAVLRGVREEAAGNGCRVRHEFEDFAGRWDLLIELGAGGPALRAKVWLENTPPVQPWRVTYLEDVAVGGWTERARRVYAGTGNVLEDPEAFELGYDGHRLATAFVGLDFEHGMSLVQAVEGIPQRLEVRPAQKRYSLHTPHAQLMHLIPAANVWDAVRTWRSLDERPAAGGVEKLAGRFVFDWWGGDYAGSASALERSFRYGLTHSVVVWHNWQRFGYDNRLPDIWPPNPRYGTPAQFKALSDLCTRHGVIFAPHDNYIDFYPDADGFSYDHIAFTRSGEPVKAWFNPGPAAQSYRWRADRVEAPLKKNVALIRNAVGPNGYFIDVWSSIEPYDYWTRDGRFFDRTYTNRTWAQLFSWIRESLGGNAPQISESGTDALIGALDGAQCNHLRVGSPEGAGNDRWFLWDVRCGDAERIPWFDAAYHDRFVLHGAGYENRFRAGLDRRRHGMYSDDYISVEVLGGHPGMAGQPFGRDVVRKYWLLDGLMTALAGARLDDFEFADRNLHRLHATWGRYGGGRLMTGGREVQRGSKIHVRVNRGSADWSVEGHILPEYGWHASADDGTQAAVERLGGSTVEWARGPAGLIYANARAGDGRRLVQVGPLSTDGACRMYWAAPADRDQGVIAMMAPITRPADRWSSPRLVIMPLPDEPACTIQIRLSDLQTPTGRPPPALTRVEALSETGEVVRQVPLLAQVGLVTLQTEPGVFAYQLVP